MKYDPKKLAAVSRYQNYFPTLPSNIQQDILKRIDELIIEEQEYCDKGNYKHMPYTDFIRTKTLCQGGDKCDFRFVRHDTDAGDGWERTNSI